MCLPATACNHVGEFMYVLHNKRQLGNRNICMCMHGKVRCLSSSDNSEISQVCHAKYLE
jgi:hypothetical protein